MRIEPLTVFTARPLMARSLQCEIDELRRMARLFESQGNPNAADFAAEADELEAEVLELNTAYISSGAHWRFDNEPAPA
jgi:hypothetical protein